jgi:hypothetical protein
MGLSQGSPDRQTVLSKVEARQGVTGHNVRCFGSALPLPLSLLPPLSIFD